MTKENRAELERLIDAYCDERAWVKREGREASGYSIGKVRAAKEAVVAFVDEVAGLTP